MSAGLRTEPLLRVGQTKYSLYALDPVPLTLTDLHTADSRVEKTLQRETLSWNSRCMRLECQRVRYVGENDGEDAEDAWRQWHDGSSQLSSWPCSDRVTKRMERSRRPMPSRYSSWRRRNSMFSARCTGIVTSICGRHQSSSDHMSKAARRQRSWCGAAKDCWSLREEKFESALLRQAAARDRRLFAWTIDAKETCSHRGIHHWSDAGTVL